METGNPTTPCSKLKISFLRSSTNSPSTRLKSMLLLLLLVFKLLTSKNTSNLLFRSLPKTLLLPQLALTQVKSLLFRLRILTSTGLSLDTPKEDNTTVKPMQLLEEKSSYLLQLISKWLPVSESNSLIDNPTKPQLSLRLSSMRSRVMK